MVELIISVLLVTVFLVILYRLFVAIYWHVQGMKMRHHLDLFDNENSDFIVSSSFVNKEDNDHKKGDSKND